MTASVRSDSHPLRPPTPLLPRMLSRNHGAAIETSVGHEFLAVRELLSLEIKRMPHDEEEKAALFPETTRLSQGPISIPEPKNDATGGRVSGFPATIVPEVHHDAASVLHALSEEINSDIERGTAGRDSINTVSQSGNADKAEHTTHQDVSPQETETEEGNHTTGIPIYVDTVKPLDLPSCGICLEEFEVGNFIAWSKKNMECPHMYHHHCMIDWLKQQDHCPECRRVYK
eukprot:Nitzschia sp. Nitz4//scaffold2_size372955//129580//130296//NITZ4_000398-RA/size372955-processed-gene-0.493-mRNA-1//-1//CDS//3329546701//8787//frame0